MGFTFTDEGLDELASKQLTSQNWQEFVAELAKHELPACYKLDVMTGDEKEFEKKLGQIAFNQSVSDSRDIIGTLLNALGSAFVLALKDDITIYEAIEMWPKMLYE